MLIDPVKPIHDRDAVAERADDLLAAGLNGLRLALVETAPATDEATVELVFLNALHVADILNDIHAAPGTAGQVFRVRGGHRLPAGPGSGQVRCTAVNGGTTDANGDLISLLLTIVPIGDYSTYVLELNYDPLLIDPFFAELPFKFRPGCFTNDCSPAWERGRAPGATPVIDYLAKDYESFRHTLFSAMAERVPGWQPTSEADLDQVLIDLLAAAGDELSDYQDRVMSEAYLATSRQRVSLARHARLVDYHIYQGNQATTWLALIVDPAAPPFTLPEELITWTAHPDDRPRVLDLLAGTGNVELTAASEWIFFATREQRLPAPERTSLMPLLNELRLHTWSNSVPALRAGSTSADLVSLVAGAAQPEAEELRDLINGGVLRWLLIEEKLNPLTGRETGHDPRRRQLLRLLPEAAALRDPLTGTWLTRVRWESRDALRSDYAFTTLCADGRVDDVSMFHGNVVRAYQGLPVRTHFYEPGAELPADAATVKHRHFERWSLYGEPRGITCALPLRPLAYLRTPANGEVAPRSTLAVDVEIGGVLDAWDEVISLVHSDDTAEEGDHFVVETDELQRSRLRFGNGVNGRLLPAGAVVHCDYQVGMGTAGNAGADTLTQFQPLSGLLADAITRVWNPFDVTDGSDPEPAAKVLRNAPEAYRARQLRAVTLADYCARAEEVPGVSRAVARYAWTGSWRTVRVVIDPIGALVLEPALRAAVAEHLEAVRLIGEDIELRPPRFVPLAIDVALCVHADVWPEDIRFVLEQEFSTGWTPDGRRGFFHPDEWTFGQVLHRSRIAGRVHAVAGVEHIIGIRMKRRNDPLPATDVAQLATDFDEIVLVQNDPDHMERGSIRFDLQGGRSG
jgi:hypothetical protein